MPKKNAKKIGVVHGGTSHERGKSVLYGKKVVKIFRDAGNNVVEIHLHPNGSWTSDGNLENLEKALGNVEHVWNALVGEDGESGLVEKLCEKCKVKILGHGSLHTNLAHNKKNFKQLLKQHNVKAPYSKVLTLENINSEALKHNFQMVGLPMLVKPLSSSGGKDIFLINNFSEYTQAIEHIFASGKNVLLEKPILGKHVSCFVFENMGLLHVHIFSDSLGEKDKLTRDEIMQIRNDALYIHNILAFPHHVKYDFILSEKGLYLLEANTHVSLVHNEIKNIFSKSPVTLSEYLLNKI